MEAIASSAHTRTENSSVVWLVLASIALHVLVLALFNDSFSVTSRNEKKPVETISARLIFAPPPPPPVVEQVIEPEPKTEPIVTPLTEEQPETIQPTKEQERPEVKEPNVPEKETAEVQYPPITAQPKNTKPRLSSQQILNQHMSQITQNRIQQLAETASREYRQRRVSPQFPAANTDPFQTEEEKIMEDVTVKVNCSTTVNKSVAMVAKLFGGAVKCSDPPAHHSFIQRRLDKVNVLSEEKQRSSR